MSKEAERQHEEDGGAWSTASTAAGCALTGSGRVAYSISAWASTAARHATIIARSAASTSTSAGCAAYMVAKWATSTARTAPVAERTGSTIA